MKISKQKKVFHMEGMKVLIASWETTWVKNRSLRYSWAHRRNLVLFFED